MVEHGSVQHQVRPDPGRERGLPGQVSHPAQVALSFLAHIGYQQQRGAGSFEWRRGFHGAGDGEQRGEARAVVGDARAAKCSVRIDDDVVAGARGQHGVEVGGESDERGAVIRTEAREDIAGAIDFRLAAQRGERGCGKAAGAAR